MVGSGPSIEPTRPTGDMDKTDEGVWPGLMKILDGQWVDMDDLDWDWVERLPEDRNFTLNMEAYFKGEKIRSGWTLKNKIESLLRADLVDAAVEKRGRNDVFTVVADKRNILEMISSPNYGIFAGDYTLMIKKICMNESEVIAPLALPETPIKRAPEQSQKVSTKEVSVMVRRGPEEFDPPARGQAVQNFLSDPREIVRILDHFGLKNRVNRVSRACPGMSTLEVGLTDDLENLMANGHINLEPLVLYTPTRQSMELLGNSPLYAHINVDKGLMPRKIILEGVVGRTNLKEVLHMLTYHGEILPGTVEEMTWKDDGDLGLKGIKNGDLSVIMRIKTDLNYLVVGSYAYKVIYNSRGNSQCSNCLSFLHRNQACDRKGEDRRSLTMEFANKWKRQMKYISLEELAATGIDLTDEEDINPDTINTPEKILDKFKQSYGEVEETGEPMTTNEAGNGESVADAAAEELPRTREEETVEVETALGNENTVTAAIGEVAAVETKPRAEKSGDTATTPAKKTNIETAASLADSENKPNNQVEKSDVVVSVTGNGSVDGVAGDLEKTNNVDKEKDTEKGVSEDDPTWMSSLKKRKGSPKTSEVAKKQNMAERERALFTTELQKLKMEAQDKHLKPVTKERIRKNLDVLVEKYKGKLGNGNPEHLRGIRAEAKIVTELLERRRSK